MKLSSADRRLLDAIQRDSTQSQAELARIAGMSRTSVWRRIREFEQAGLVTQQVALLDPHEAGFRIQVLLSVAMTEHTDEVTECFSVSGERDYILHVLVPDMDGYNDFLNAQILRHPAVRSASSTFVLRRIKYTTRLPLDV